MSTIHADMLTLQCQLRQEDFDALFRQTTTDEDWHDAEYDEWIDAFLANLEQPYIPFQLPTIYYIDVVGTLHNEIGYVESVTPYLF